MFEQHRKRQFEIYNKARLFFIENYEKLIQVEKFCMEMQPLDRITLVSIPNGILLAENPNYLKIFPGLLFPGKDDKEKDPRKVRTRISFEKLRHIAEWRYKDFAF